MEDMTEEINDIELPFTIIPWRFCHECLRDDADEGTNYRIRDFRRNEEPRCDDTAMVLHQGKGGNPS